MVHSIKLLALLATLATLLVAVTSVRAAEMCAPGEDPVVCSIIEERNNALDELAKAEGARRRLAIQAEREHDYWKRYVEGETENSTKRNTETAGAATALADYWQHYVAGLPNMTVLAAHVAGVCGWHGTLNEPTAKLCAWWKGEMR